MTPSRPGVYIRAVYRGPLAREVFDGWEIIHAREDGTIAFYGYEPCYYEKRGSCTRHANARARVLANKLDCIFLGKLEGGS